MPGRTITYADSLLFLAFLDAIDSATTQIYIATFIFKSSYVGETRARMILNALKRAAARGVQVCVVLNYSRYEPDVASENYATGLELVAAGCSVCMAPPNETMHTKLALIDNMMVFIGSHNITRGAFTSNDELTVCSTTRDMCRRGMEYFAALWYRSIPFAQVPPPSAMQKIGIDLLTVVTQGAELKLTFTVTNPEGVDAFAGIASAAGNLAGAIMGPSVGPTIREALVTPGVAAGEEVYVAVRAYIEGQAVATSNVIQRTYQPTEPGGGGDGEGGGGGDEPPPPEPLTAPHLTTVTQTDATEVTAAWDFVGHVDFYKFEIQQRDLMANWHVIGVTMDPAARQWTGTPVAITDALPFRVVVYTHADDSAASNEVALTQPPPPEPLTAPVLSSVVAGLNGTEITATWTFPGCENFHRFEVQKRDAQLNWSAVGTISDPNARQWVGPGPGAGFTEATYGVVVFNVAEESAASNEITITGEPPVPLTPPVLVSVTQIGPMGINVEYSHVTPAEFARYEVQQRTNELWNTLATITTPETRSWSGGPIPYMDTSHPVRVVVFVQSGDSAASNEMTITPM